MTTNQKMTGTPRISIDRLNLALLDAKGQDHREGAITGCGQPFARPSPLTRSVVPSRKYGAAKLPQYWVNGPGASGNLAVSEQLSKIDDPYGVYGALQPNASPLVNGRLDDCYSLYTNNPLPSDFILKVQQIHLINGQIIDQNEMTYRPKFVHVCQHGRLPGSCSFSKRCK